MKQAIEALKPEVTHLSQKLDDAFKVIHQQQLFLESLDSKDWRHNPVLLGVLEDEADLGNTDAERICKILEAAGCEEADKLRWVMMRLGQCNDRHKRPTLVSVNDQRQRDSILRKARNLKDA